MNAPKSEVTSTKPQDRVPAIEKFAIGLGQAAAMGTHNALTTLSSPVYNVLMGMNPAYLSALTFIQRLWDAFLDPLVGQFSDNLSTRWGRRKPLIFAAALPAAAMFAAIWWFPRNISASGLIIYFFVTSLAFYFFHSFLYVPVTALQVEATPDYHERTRVASIAGICTWAFSIINQWLYPLLESKWFSNPISGTRCITGGAAILYAIMALAPAWLVHERAPKSAGLPRQRLFDALRDTCKNRDFLVLLGIRSVSQFGFSVVAVLGFYLNCYMIHGGDLAAASTVQGWLGTAYVVASVFAFWFFRVVAIAIGKRRTLQVAAAFLVIGAALKLIVYQPGLKWAQLVVPATNGLALSGISLITIAMLADVVSADELETRRRREGLYCSVLSWFDKFGSSSGALLSGILLVLTGFDAKLGGAQPAATLLHIKWLYAALPCIGGLVTVVLAQRYSLQEAKAYEIKQALEARNAEQAAQVISS